MNRLLLFLVLISLSGEAWSQDTPPITNKPNLSRAKSLIPVKLFSAHPTVQEIAGVFEKAGAEYAEPMSVVQQLILGGPDFVPVLASILSADSVITPVQATDSGTVVRPQLPNRVLAVYALDGIGSADAYAAIMAIGATHRDAEIRAASLNTLVNSYLEKVKSGVIKADKEIVHLLLKNADNSALAPSLHLSVAQIAREGLRRWLNWDLGIALKPQYNLVVDKIPKTMSSDEYWEYWWSVNNSKLVWAASVGNFKISE